MKEGWVYVLRERDFLTGKTDRYVKIGLTENEVELRNKQHQTGNPRLIYSVHEQHVPLMNAMEKHLHHVYSTDRIHGEWFDLDDARVNNEVIPMIERLAVEQAETKAHMETVADLKKAYDNGTERKPNATETALHNAYLEAKHAFERAKAQHAIHDSAIRAMIGTAGGIEGVVEVKPKSQGPLFNKKAFLALLSEAEQATCHKTVTEFKASLSITGTKTLKTLDHLQSTKHIEPGPTHGDSKTNCRTSTRRLLGITQEGERRGMEGSAGEKRTLGRFGSRSVH